MTAARLAGSGWRPSAPLPLWTYTITVPLPVPPHATEGGALASTHQRLSKKTEPEDRVRLNCRRPPLNTEQVDLAAAAIAELANGGRFYDPQFYTEQQRAFWRRVALAALNAAIGAPPDSSPPEKSPNPAGSAG